MTAACLLLAGCEAPPREVWQRPTAPPPAVIDCEHVPSDEYPVELPAFDLYVEWEDWDALHVDVTADVEVDASVCFEGVRYPIELELQGASSRKAAKKSFDFKFNRGRKLPGTVWSDGDGSEKIEKLFLKGMARDQSLIREAVAFDLARAMGTDAPRNGFANLRVNGQYWGLYVLVEPVGEDFLERRGYAPGGTLYKGVRTKDSLADFAEGRNLTKAFEDKTPRGMGDREDLKRLVAALQETPLELTAFESAIDPIFSLDAYIDRMVWVAFTQNSDAAGQNFYLYNTPTETSDRWTQLPWDSDICCGAHWKSPDRIAGVEAWPMMDGGNHFSRRMLEIDALHARYLARFRELLDTVLTGEFAASRARAHGLHIAHDLALDQRRWERAMSPQTALDTVLDFFAGRPDFLQREVGQRAAVDPGEALGSEQEAQTEPEPEAEPETQASPE